MNVGDRIALLTATGVLAGVVVATGALMLHSLSGIQAQLSGIQTRIDRIEARIDRIEIRIDRIEIRIDELDATLRQAIREGDESVRQEVAALRQAVEEGDESVRQEVADLRQRVFRLSGNAEHPSVRGGS